MKFLVRTLTSSHFYFYYVFIYFNLSTTLGIMLTFMAEIESRYWLGQAKAKPKSTTTKLHVSIISKSNNTLCYNISSVFHIY